MTVTGHECSGNSYIRGSLKFSLRLTSCSGPFTHKYPEGAAWRPWRLMLRPEPSHIFFAIASFFYWRRYFSSTATWACLSFRIQFHYRGHPVSWWYMHMRVLLRLSAPHACISLKFSIFCKVYIYNLKMNFDETKIIDCVPPQLKLFTHWRKIN